jgi:N-acetylglucosamine-6-sulfatase
VSSVQSSARIRNTALAATALATLGAVTLSGIAAAASFPTLPGDPPRPPGPDPRSPAPDIVTIVLDDIPPLDGRLWKKLPNIRRNFVQEGLQFTDAHVETPTCTPGRAGLLTGQHTHHHGAYATNGVLFDPRETVATELQAEGYHTVLVGKYLNLFDGFADKWPPGWDEFHGFGGGYYDYTMYSNGIPQWHGRRPSDYSTDVIAGLTRLALARAPRDEPLFAWIAPYAMHKPWSVAPRYRESGRCNGIAKWHPNGFMEVNVGDKPDYVGARRIVSPDGYDLKRICRGMLSVDAMIGDIVKQLRKRGRLDNTMLILTSDNGMAYGSQRFLHDKKAPYGTQVPLMVRWPRVLGTVPKQVTERVQNIDLAPTLCDIAGCAMGPYPNGATRSDGASLLKLITADRKKLRRASVITSYQDEARVPRYWSITSTGSSPLAGKLCAKRKQDGCRWMYTEYETGETELYDLSNGPCHDWKRSYKGDPCMLKNKSGQPRFAAIERELREELRRRTPLPHRTGAPR